MTTKTNILDLLSAGQGGGGTRFHQPADVRGYDDDDDLDDEIGEDGDDDDDDEVDDLIEGIEEAEEDDDEEAIGFNRRAAKKKLRRKKALLRRLQVRRPNLRGPARRHNANRIRRVKAQIRALEKALKPKRKGGGRRPRPRPRPGKGTRPSAAAGGDHEVILDPSAGYTVFPMLPTAAPAGEWAGAVNSPRLTCTLAGVESAAQDIQTRQMPYLKWQILTLRVSFSNALASSGLGGLLATTADVEGDAPLFAATGRTDLSPWFVGSQQAPPGLRYNGIIEGTMRAQMSIVGVGVAGDILVVGLNAVGWILEDSRRKTAPNLVRRGPYPGGWSK